MKKDAKRRRRSLLELEAHLENQLAYLKRSADAFDEGDEFEAIRLAVSIRVLLHDSPTSKSLLGQLDRKNTSFCDTALLIQDIDNTPGFCGLAMIEIVDPPRYVAMLDDMPSRLTPFREWWSGVVLTDHAGNSLSRERLIIIAANQDGGAHVDASIDERYAALSRDNAVGLFQASAGRVNPLPDPVPATIRQIGHEVLKTLEPAYARNAVAKGPVSGGFTRRPYTLVMRAFEPTAFSIGPDELCSCGSGKKVLQCHGAPGTLKGARE
jgi:hypothetical protein